MVGQGRRNTDSSKEPGKPTNREIMEYYDLLRRREEAAAKHRSQEVISRVPRILDIENEISGLNRDLSKLIISGAANKMAAGERIRRSIESLIVEKAFLLTENGYECDYMDVRYSCPDCLDTGILRTGEKCPCYNSITRDMINEMQRTSQGESALESIDNM